MSSSSEEASRRSSEVNFTPITKLQGSGCVEHCQEQFKFQSKVLDAQYAALVVFISGYGKWLF